MAFSMFMAAAPADSTCSISGMSPLAFTSAPTAMMSGVRRHPGAGFLAYRLAR